jgi:Na+-transporting NADH:ubiquinone oxidoreductase subunit NqrC
MDQIAVMGLKALQAYKAQLDKAQEFVEVARTLSRKIEIFEVTIGMIPKRGNKDDVNKIVKATPGDEVVETPSKEEKKGMISNFELFIL